MISSGFVKGIQNEMRKDDGVDGDAQRLSQLVWLIFLKVLDDDERQKEFLNGNYKAAVPDKYRWTTWAGNDDGITGEALLDFVNNDLFPALKNLEVNQNNRRTSVVKEVFANSFNYMKNGTQLRKVINKINDIDFNSTEDRHSFGEIYETLLASLQSAGNAGEFYTPRAITNFIVDRVDPKLGERVFDPAAGTGGFLTGAIDHMRKEARTIEDEHLLQNSILGVEKKQLPYTLLVTNMIFHGLEEPSGIRHDNTLARPLISYGPDDFVDVITANPPFGGSEEDGIEDNFPSTFRTRETADLFLVLFVRLLKNGGRAGIVLPDGTLFGEGIKTRIKQYLLEECNLHTIVRLPNSVFAPYTSIATNLLFFTKGESTKEIWYYEHQLPDGVKAYNKTKPIRVEEFEPIRQWWNKREESDVAWKVSIDEIKKRGYNLDIKNPNAKIANELDPVEVLENYRNKWSEVDKIADMLQVSLRETLDNHSNKEVRFLIENLHEYLRVPHAISLLRKNVLHLAISGQLVPQVAEEGKSEDLYKDYLSNKNITSNARNSKKQKELLPIAEEEKPFAIPTTWEWVRLGEVCELKSGNQYKYTLTNETGTPYVKVGDMNLEQNATNINISSQYYVTSEINKNDLIVENSIIFPKRGGAIATNKKRKVHKPILIDSNTMAVKPSAMFDFDYFYIWFSTKDISQFGDYSAVPQVNNKDLLPMPIPLPPIREQIRIVQKTTELLDLVAKLDKYLE